MSTGDLGILSEALARGNALGTLKLRALKLGDCAISSDGMSLLAQNMCSAQNKCMLNLTELCLEQNGIGDLGMISLSRIVGKGHLLALEKLFLKGNLIGDSGMEAFCREIKHAGNGDPLPKLEVLTLHINKIGQNGFNAFSTIVEESRLPQLRWLGISENPGDPTKLRNALEHFFLVVPRLPDDGLVLACVWILFHLW